MSSSVSNSAAGQPQFAEGSLFGRYRIVKRLGEGAMGAVFLAHDAKLNDRPVALKIPKFTGDDRDVELLRFQREAGISATMSHPNLCPVYDVGEFDGVHYLAMGFIDGKPLNEVVGGKPVAEKQAAILVRKIALAMQTAHDKGVVHRDLKPANIMLDARKEPIVMDFGLAKQAGGINEAQITQSGMILGTPAYMSPEQVAGETDRIGPASDVYSLGVILYELLTGVRPFQGPITAVLGQIIAKEPPPPREHRPSLDPKLETIALKAIAKKLEARYASMTAFAAALGEYIKQLSASASQSMAKVEEPLKPAGELSLGSVAALVDAARQCVRAHDYAEAVRLFETIPARHRSAEIETLRKQAASRQDEVNGLQMEIELACEARKYKSLAPKLERMLKLKPGHTEAKKLLERLNTYGGTKAKLRYNDAGELLPAPKADGLFDGMGLKYAAVIGVAVVAFGIGSALVYSYLQRAKSSPKEIDPGPPSTLNSQPSANVPPSTRFALEFSGQGEQVEFIDLLYRAPEPVTLEIRCRAHTNEPGNILGCHDTPTLKIFDGRFGIEWSEKDPAEPQPKPNRILAQSEPVPGQDVLLAMTYDGQAIAFFLDGKFQGQKNVGPSIHLKPDYRGLPLYVSHVPTKFQGQVFEVRVSNIARYSGDYLPPDRLESDANTIGLYRFDEGQGDVLTDSSGHNHHGKIMGAKWGKLNGLGSSVTSTATTAANALAFDGKSLVKIEADTPIKPKAMTLEGWVKPSQPGTYRFSHSSGTRLLGHLFHNGSPANGPAAALEYERNNDGAYQWRLVGTAPDGLFHTTSSPLEFGKRTHVAGVIAADGLVLYINGRQQGSRAIIPNFTPQQAIPFVLGGSELGQGSLVGDVQQFRISGRVRYVTDFTPPQRFEADADTIALYHFDEGQGEVVNDSSGHNHHGKIVGAKWVRVAGTTMNSERAAAEWVLSVGGAVRVNGDERLIRDAAELPKERFALSEANLYRNKEVRDAELVRLAEYGELLILNLSGTQITDSGLKHLKAWQNLTHLDVGATAVTDAGLDQLQHLKKLVYLYLGNTAVTDAGLARLHPLTALTHLALDAVPITDEGLIQLQGLQGLLHLGLRNTAVTDAGLTHLQALKGLTYLDVRKTKVTERGLAAFHTAVPGCQIEHDGGVIAPTVPPPENVMEESDIMEGDSEAESETPPPGQPASSVVLTSPDWEWTKIKAMSNFNTPAQEVSICLTGKEKLIFFVRDAKPMLAARRGKNTPYSAPRTGRGPLGRLNRPVHALSITDDSRVMVLCMKDEDAGDNSAKYAGSIWMCERGNLNEPFSEPVRLPDVVNVSPQIRTPWISHDGLILIVSRPGADSLGDADLYQHTRKSRKEPFGPPLHLGSVANTPDVDYGGTLSADGLLLFRTTRKKGAGEIAPPVTVMCTRPSFDRPFDKLIPLDPELAAYRPVGIHCSRSGTRIHFHSPRSDENRNSDLYLAERTSKKAKGAEK